MPVIEKAKTSRRTREEEQFRKSAKVVERKTSRHKVLEEEQFMESVPFVAFSNSGVRAAS